ncbi:MAG: hypothetical protein Kow0069_10900 [Promethearchaeota archaeon]
MSRRAHLAWFTFALTVLAVLVPTSNAQFNPVAFPHVEELTFERNSSTWSDDQWRFFRIELPKEERLLVNVSPSGPLDVDARLYSSEDGVRPWDITREGMKNFTYKANSQFRGPFKDEVLGYKNEVVLGNETLYLLVFVIDGYGSTNVSIQANFPLHEYTPPVGGFEGWFNANSTYVYIGVGVLFVLVMVQTKRKAGKVKRAIAEQLVVVTKKK